jgi:UDP-N-acetylglucosamine 2-epimerase (non-hydrolysing)
MQILHIVGARPNFMKLAPVYRALSNFRDVNQTLVHTGQHYDANMSDVFFQQLAIPKPDLNLGVGSGSHTVQTARIMTELEPALLERKPDLVLVYGDVNSTVAAALVCAKLLIRIGHIEAGLRSGDRTMPEEVNRLVTDQLADILFTPSVDGNENLVREGVSPHKIHFVGNVMIDTLIRFLDDNKNIPPLVQPPYALVTLHRPSNVDDAQMLGQILKSLNQISHQIPVVFPVHPRTRQRIKDFGIESADTARMHLIDPVGYVEFLTLQRHAALVITDSGGIQEETTFLGIPCLTVRENTERPITTSIGTNKLIGRDMELLYAETSQILQGNFKRGETPPLWDGKAGQRIAELVTKC